MSDDATHGGANDDVRMRGFARRTTVDDALAWVDAQTQPLGAETVPLAAAAGRVVADEVVSRVDVPGFDRAMMDGYAVRATDVAGASPYNRLPLAITGLALPGAAWSGAVQSGQAVRIMTGAPVPNGADAVLPAERTEVDDDRLLAVGEVAPAQHIGRCGEDVAAGATVLCAGRRLRPQDLGVLSSIGVAEVAVVRRPRVRIVISGDELLPAGSSPSGVRIVDANSPMLSALVEGDGGELIGCDMVADQPNAILAAMRRGADVTLVSGGSSVGQEDHAPRLLAEHGELAIHGIAMRPASPTGMGRLEDHLVFLLPGNPVACLCAYQFFAGRAIRTLTGRARDWPNRQVRRPLRRKISSIVGRVEYARVALVGDGVEPLAVGGASVLTSTTRADGFVIVPSDSEGFGAGSDVDVYLYD